MSAPVAASLAVRLRSDVEEVAGVLAARIAAADSAYTESGPITEEELREACRANLTEIIHALAGDEPNLQPAYAVGRLKAERGVPISSLLHAFRLGGRLIWEQLTDLADGPSDPELLDLVSRQWDLIDTYSDAAVQSYRDTESLLVHSDAQARYRLIRTLFDDHADSPIRPLTAMRTLGIPEDGVFVVVMIVPPEAGAALPVGLDVALRDTGALPVWDGQVDVHVGLLRTASIRESDRSVDRLGDLVDGRIGVSVAFTNPARIPAALAEARLAARSIVPGVDRLVRYGSDPTAHLLATVPEAGASMARQILGPVLTLPAPERDDLLSVLSAWYECAGAAADVADRLHCHRNTVRYRLRKVRDLTGRDVTDPIASAELFLALRGAELLGLTR